MNTIFVVLIAVALLLWCGMGPTLLLLRKPSPYRLPAIPVIGLCSCVVLTFFLARFGLTGRSIAMAALVIFGVCNVLGWWVGRPSIAEFRSAIPVALFCFAAVAIAAWPLMRMGYGNYWGFANPDHAFYITVLSYLDAHSFGLPDSSYFSGFHELTGEGLANIPYGTSAILGISYFISMLSRLTNIPIPLLFGVSTAAVACIVPSSVFVLCSLGLQLPRRVSLVAAGLTACSSLVAYTFYLHSLGTMTVIAILPVGVASVLDYFRDPRFQKLALPALIFAGACFDYFPLFAILGLATASIALWAWFTGKARAGAVAVMGICSIGAPLAVWGPQVVTIFHRMLAESSFEGTQFSRTNELLVAFALVLTERGLPFFWGLRLPFGVGTGLFAWLAVSALFFLGLGLGIWRKLSGLCGEYFCAIGAILGLVVVYAVKGTGGYGAFKIVAWIHPLVLAGLGASMMGLWHWLRIHGHRVLSLLPLLVLSAYAGLNLANALQLGRESMGGDGASLNNAPRLELKDFRELQEVAERWGSAGIVLALPDSVAQYWLMPFLGHSSGVTQFFPHIPLNVEDSSPLLTRDPPMGAYVLHWADGSQEVSGLPLDAAVWRNRRFALTPLAAFHDVMIFGQGWYRKEGVDNSPFEWQRHLRWLRKRGELLILNPSSKQKQVALDLVAGYGNSSPERHIDFYLNGEKFDEIDLHSQARVLTRPFTATAPWSQLELAIREDASPLARDHALWNRWVPTDARRLNVGVSAVSLIDAGQTDASLESAMNFGPGKKVEGTVDGVYADGWIGESANVVLRVPARPEAIEIAGSIPGVSCFHFPYQVALALDGAPIEGARILVAGEFHLRVPLRGIGLVPGRAVRIALGPFSTFTGRSQGSNNDDRKLSILLNRIALVGTAEQDEKAGGKPPSRN